MRAAMVTVKLGCERQLLPILAVQSYASARKPKVSSVPLCVLDDDPISVRVFKCPAVLIPIGIERWNHWEARSFHPIHRRLTFVDSGQVEDQKVVLRRGSPGSMSVRSRKFEVIWCAPTPEHDAVETIMVRKPA